MYRSTQTQKGPLSPSRANGLFFRGLWALNAEKPLHRSRAENAPSATSPDTASISPASGRSSAILADFARTTACALLARAPVCSGASKSIPWHEHSSSIAIVFRKFTSMRPNRRAPLIPIET